MVLFPQALQQYNAVPDYNCYLVHVLARMKAEPENIRMTAGLLLKNNMKEFYHKMPPAAVLHIQNELLVNIGDPSQQIRGTIGSVVTTIVAQLRPVRTRC